MARTLLLLRHAKSSWDQPGLADFDRPLAGRGLKAAPEMGAYIAVHGLVPELILCSTSARTRQTLDLVLPALGLPSPEIVYEDGLYLASVSDLVERVRRLPAKRSRVMVIGHNPGMHGAALTLAGRGSRTDIAALAAKFPTAALAVLKFGCDSWREARPASGRLDRFVTPRTLPAARDAD